MLGYRFRRCLGWGLVFMSPRPTAEALRSLYCPAYFQSHDPTWGYPGYQSWPHPKTAAAEAVDVRLVALIRRALPPLMDDDSARRHQAAELIADRVWAWLAEGDV